MSGSLYARALLTDPETGMTAEDWDPVRQGLTDWTQAQQQKSYDMGLADPATGWPTRAGVAALGPAYANALLFGTTAPGEAPGITVYHGSPHSFDRFDIGKIGTGEGAQAYGHGLYFAEREGTARSYRDQLAGPPAPGEFLHSGPLTMPQGGFKPVVDVLERHRGDFNAAIGDPAVSDSVKGTLRDWQKSGVEYLPSQSPGHMYEVNIAADPEHFLHWDKPLSEQSPYVQEQLGKLGITPDQAATMHDKLVGQALDTGGAVPVSPPRGQDFYEHLGEQLHSGPKLDDSGWTAVAPTTYRDPAAAAQALRDVGIPGIRYYDQGSRTAGKGSHNFVVFDPDTLEILRKYGIAGLGLGGAAAGNALDQPSDNAQ